jgi:hypothetical protein
LNKIREKLTTSVTAANDNAYVTSHKTSAKSQALYIAYCSQDLSKLIDETEGAIAKYRNGTRWGEKFIMDKELDNLKDNARRVIDLLKTITGALDENTLNQCIQRTQVGVYSYILGLGMHIIMLETENSLDLLERYFKNQESFITEFRGHINELVNISLFGVLNPEDGTKKLDEFSKKLEPFQKRGQELLNANKMAFAIAKTVIVIVIAALCSWGIGLLIGGIVTLAGGGGALLAASTFVGQVLAFTISSKVLEGIIDGESIWFDSTKQFFMELGTTALMFLVFSIAGKVGQTIAKALGYKMAMLTVRFMTQWITMMVVTTPVFAYQLASRGQLTDKDEWIQFLTVQAIASALLAGIFAGAHNRMKLIDDMTKSWVGKNRTRWETIKFEQRRATIENEMTVANNQWKAIDDSFRKDFKPSLETTKKMRQALSSVINQAETLLKAVELLNRDLRIFRKNCPVAHDAMLELISPEEVATAKFLMKESFSRLDIAKYTANQNTVLVQSIKKSIPGTQLVPLEQSTTYYQSNGFATKLDQVKALTHSKGTTVRLVDVPRTSLFSQLPERYREGIVRLMAEWQVAHKGGVTKSGVVEIVILDKNAEGIVRKELLMPRLEPPKRAAPEDVKITPAPVIRNLDMYIKMCKLPKADLINFIKDHPADMIWSNDELVAMYKDLQSKGGISYLKSQGVKKMLVFRIQEHTRGFSYRPAIFLGDPISYVGYDNLTSAKNAIGYGVESSESPAKLKNNTVYFWEADINDVIEANWENTRDVVNEYLKWGREWYNLEDPKTKRPQHSFDVANYPQHIDAAYGGKSHPSIPFVLKALIQFMNLANKYGFLNSDYASKLNETEWNKAWKQAIDNRNPKEGMFTEMEKKAIAKNIMEKNYATEMPELGLGKLIGEVGFFDQYGGKGFGVTPLGQPGGMEWMLKYNEKNSFVIETNLQQLEKLPADEVFKKGK